MIKRIDNIYRTIEQEHGLLPDLNPYEYGTNQLIAFKLIRFVDGDLGDETDSEKVNIRLKL